MCIRTQNRTTVLLYVCIFFHSTTNLLATYLLVVFVIETRVLGLRKFHRSTYHLPTHSTNNSHQMCDDDDGFVIKTRQKGCMAQWQ